MAKAKKAVLIGIDSVPRWLLDEFVARGCAPTIGKLIQNGCYTQGRSYCPVETGTNWAVISTGAAPMTTGCNMGTHLPGMPLNQTVRGFPSHLCKAEQLWNAAARAGKRSVIFDYPQSRPYNCPNVIHVGEDGRPGRSFRAIQEMRGYIAGPSATDKDRFKVGFATEVRFEPAVGWDHLPATSPPALAATLPILPDPSSEISRAGELYGLLLPEPDGAFRSVRICSARDGATVLGQVRLGEWSETLRHVFDTNLGPVEAHWRAKLLELAPDAGHMRLYFSQVYPLRGFAHPPEIEDKLLAECGPFVPHTCRQQTIMSGAADIWTFMEEVERTVAWYRKAMEIILSTEEWSLFIMKWHPTDFANHFGAFMIEPRHPQFDPSREQEGWDYQGQIMRYGDQLVATAAQMAGKDALICVVSDHGATALPPGMGGHVPNLVAALEKAGLLARNAAGGIDWSKTRAFPTQHYVYVNLRGRDPDGIVEPGEEYERTRQQIIDAVLDVKDPQTRRHAVNWACRREDAWMVGVGGERVGDVFIWAEDHEPQAMTRQEFEARRPDLDLGSWEMPRCSSGNHTPDPFLVMAGPGLKKGWRRQVPVWLSAVAPTVALAAGFPVPAQADGAAIWDFFKKI